MPSLPALFDGCKLFPCIAGTKDPATKHGWHDASSDPTQIAEWERLLPDCNWAVACGPSNLFVFDIDPNGMAYWQALVANDPDVRETVSKALIVETPKGGLHVYFRGEGPSTASRIADGIDTRGGITLPDGKIVSGGYVILPGSRTKAGPGRVDGAYSVKQAGEIAPLSAHMRSIVPERKKASTQGLEKNPLIDKPRNVSWAVDLLKNYASTGRVSIEGSGGNNTAFQVAASILDKAISPAMCFDLMAEHWNPHCKPVWDEWELETVIRNAAAYGEDTEGGVKGFQSNDDAFNKYTSPEFLATLLDGLPPEPEPDDRDAIKWLHEYADGVRDPEWLIPGIIPAQGIGMIYGESGSYKSFLALDMSLCLAHGIPGQWGAPPIKNTVLFLAGEGPVATARKRWPAWAEWQGIEFRNDHRFLIKDRVPFYTDTDAWERMKAQLATMQVKPALIVIDTLTRLLTGMDENSTKDATVITGFMEALARYFECFVLAIHHTGKDQNKGARGSSAFYANMDAVLSTKIRSGGTELRVRKQKDADTGDESNYFMVKEVAQSIVLERVDALPEEPRKGGKPRADWASREEIVRVLESNGSMSTSVLAQTIAGRYGIEKKKVQDRISRDDDLRWLHPSGDQWEIPKSEYDL